MNIGIDIEQFRMYVVRPALRQIEKWSQAAENLVLGTAIQESHLRYLDQLTPGPGPAYGLFQMEAATYEDIWRNYIQYREGLRENLLEVCYLRSDGLAIDFFPGVDELRVKLDYAAAMCRVYYLRIPVSLPNATDVTALATYWKKYYNTSLGKGTIPQAIEAFKLVVQ